MLALRKKLEDATKEGSKRIVLQFDEANAIWSLARTPDNKYDTGLIGNVVNVLKDLSEKNYDVLFACNADPNDPLGLGSILPEEELQALFEGDLGKWYREVYQKEKIPLSLPDTETKARIAAVYLTRLSERLGITSGELFDSQLNNLINNEEALAQELKRTIEDRFKGSIIRNGQILIQNDQIKETGDLNKFAINCKEHIGFSQLTQGLVEDVINNNLNTEGGSNLITLDMVVNSLVKKIEPNDSVDEQIERQLQDVRKTQLNTEQLYTPNVKTATELIERLDEQQLLALWNDERGKELLTPFQDDSILNRPTIAKELHAKLLISFIKKKFPEVE